MLELAGDLDAATASLAPEPAEALTLEAGQRVVLGLSGLRFCDSSDISCRLTCADVLIGTHNAERGDAFIVPTGTRRPASPFG
ncbi:hypothetical protein SK854_41975 [Lentzea sp. BCCO 10_0061]|uniref:STAS domain-containing protein n=1 Tax=Lentzea sokolovensis TaxID=3095429 RepID=A0ABU4VC25_9PSEU|nr:hypothetical protein [Lentzea sp. BCCO 10_0061]MDX8148744.1 hypothetical protein [Lentzea sp. BCCO 10_0061]